MHAWLASLGAHPYLVLAVVFAVACAESLAVVGTFVPAGLVMFAAGALIGAGALNGWATLAVATLGAVAGDGISYELGRRYHREVRAWWAAKGHEASYARGERFVQRHGGKSIALARFFAPVRAIVPLIAGAAGMPRRRFYTINVASALAWAPAHIGPGIVFGASAQLAGAVSGRLAAMLLLMAALLWLVVRLTRLALRHGVPFVKTASQMAVRRLCRRYPRLASRLSRLADAGEPGSQTLVVLALLFVGSVWLFLGTLEDVVAHDPLVRADVVIYSFLQTLRTAPTDYVMAAAVELSAYGAGLAVAAAVLVWLIVQRCWRTAGYWIFAVAVASVLSPAIEAGRHHARPFTWQEGAAHAPWPSGAAAFNVLVYAFLGWLLVRRQAPLWRSAVITVVAVWVALAGFARLYLGENWLADVLEGWSLGLAWFAVLAGVYLYRGVRDDVRPKRLPFIVGAVLAVFGSWSIAAYLEADLARYSPGTRETVLTPSQWTDGGWRALPARRTELSGDEEEYFPLQWADGSDAFRDRLESAGWRAAPAWTAQSALLWLSPKTSVDALPVLPKLAQGESSELAFEKFDPGQPMNRLVLRLWRSHYRLAAGSIAGNPASVPIWYGALYQEAFHRPWQLVTIGITTSWPDASAVASRLPADLRALNRSTMQGGSVRRVVLVLPSVPETSLSSRSIRLPASGSMRQCRRRLSRLLNEPRNRDHACSCRRRANRLSSAVRVGAGAAFAHALAASLGARSRARRPKRRRPMRQPPTHRTPQFPRLTPAQRHGQPAPRGSRGPQRTRRPAGAALTPRAPRRARVRVLSCARAAATRGLCSRRSAGSPFRSRRRRRRFVVLGFGSG
jgi:membrane protein DedA with SNARE-associated domain/membrane-associated phospholipid phosphatase